MVIAAYLPGDVVNQGQKLALMKICDSADDETRLSKPGLRRLRAWVGVSEKRTMTIVTELVAKGLVERVEVGKAGRRAVYRVFPLGVPTIPSNDELEGRFAASDAAPKNPRKARQGVSRARPSKPAMNREDIDARALAAGEGVKKAGFHGWNPDEESRRVPPVEPSGFHGGNPEGSTGGTPSFPSSSSVLPSPPTPAADAAGEPRGCPKHTAAPAANCRGCGTNPRAGRAAVAEQRKAAAHRAEQQQMHALRADLEEAARRAEERPEDVEAARLAAREAARAGRSRMAHRPSTRHGT
ncbi:hypothetical protein BX257_4042 [Streptomyces sp. 3212.3]|nr:hypothetical protein BX257_4042 [Streptomyces sp. 3212.3]